MLELPSLHSFVNPMTSPSPSPSTAPKPPALPTRRSSQRGGIVMSQETRPPRELLARIGINGKEVVRIIKERHWEVEDPHGLQQQNIYYRPEAKEKGKDAQQNEDFFVGEGELYAFILKQGGLRYLLPNEELSSESDESDVVATQPSKPPHEDEAENSVEESDAVSGNNSSTSATESAGGGTKQRKWKRRKKLSTKSQSVEKTSKDRPIKTPSTRRRRKISKQKAATSRIGDEEVEQDQVRMTSLVKLEQATYGGIGQQTEFSEYESSLTARGWRAQLLQDIDLHLLRSVSAVDRRHRALEALNEGQKKIGRPTEGVGPHVQDAVEILQELEGLAHSIRASQSDLSSMIELIIMQGEQLIIPDRIDSVGRIGIPGFVSTGPSSLVLVRDIERYMLLFVAAVRRYQRSRKVICANEPANGSSQQANRAVKRTDLRALQLGIEESKRELQELATISAAEASKSCQDPWQDTASEITQIISQSTSQGAAQHSTGTVRADAIGS